MSLTAEQRAAIVRTAKSWIGTPYHHQAALKGVGADCAMFPIAVYKECNVLPQSYQPPEYSMQWHLHRSDELYLAEIAKFCNEIPVEDSVLLKPPRPADFVVFHFGRTFSHGAIVVEWPICIHSYIHHGVTLMDALRDGEVVGRRIKYFEVDMEKIAVFSSIPNPALRG
jgi:cell wall-associated NlpC family hydrolase